MKRFTLSMLGALLAAGLVFGCGGDAVKQMLSKPETQAQVMDMIGASPEMAGTMIDKLLSADGTRGMVLEKLMASGPAAQEIMTNIARDQSMVDGVLNLAVQDSSMRAHIMTLFRGMQMAGRR